MSSEVKLPDSQDGGSKLKKEKVSVFAVAGMFYSEVCSGAFGIEEMISESGPGMTIIMLIFLGIFWMLPVSLLCAEMGSARPDQGGICVWVREAMGEFWYGIVLICITMWGILANTVYIVLSVSYLELLIDIPAVFALLLKVGLVVFFFILNVKGVRDMSMFSTVLNIAIVLAFAAVVVVGFMNMTGNPMEPMQADPDQNGFIALSAGLSVGIWMYCGMENISLISGEVEDAEHVIPKGILICTPVIILNYVLPTIASTGSINRWSEWSTEPNGVGWATVLTENGVEIGGVLFIIISIVAQLTAYNVTMGVGARGVYMLSEDHFGPKWVAGVSKKYGTPVNALLVTTLVCLALMPFDFTFLTTLEVFFVALIYALMGITCIILKRRIPDEEFKFKYPGGRIVHHISCAIIIFICVWVTVVSGMDYFFGGLIAVVLLPILYVPLKKTYKGSSFKDPVNYPLDPRTGLCYGDYKWVGGTLIGDGLYGLIGERIVVWFDGGFADGAAYYMETYGSGILSDMQLMFNIIMGISIACLVIGGIVFAHGVKLAKEDPVKK